MSLIVDKADGTSLIIPDEFRLPGGFVVTVRRLNPRSREFRRLCEKDWACFDSNTHTIYLREDREGADLIRDYVHEMKHAFVDWSGHMEPPGDCPCAE